MCPTGAVTWISNASGNWNVATNWDTDTVPGAADDVCIEVGGITVTVSDVRAAQSLVASDNISITFGGSLALTNPSEITGALTISGTIEAGADLTLLGSTTWNSSPASTATSPTEGRCPW